MMDNKRADTDGRRIGDNHVAPCPGLEALEKIIKDSHIDKLDRLDPEKISKSGSLNTILLLVFGALVTLGIFISASGRGDVAEYRKDTVEIRNEWVKFQKDSQSKADSRDASVDRQMQDMNKTVSSLDKNVFAFIERTNLIMEYSAKERADTKEKIDTIINSTKPDYRTN